MAPTSATDAPRSMSASGKAARAGGCFAKGGGGWQLAARCAAAGGGAALLRQQRCAPSGCTLSGRRRCWPAPWQPIHREPLHLSTPSTGPSAAPRRRGQSPFAVCDLSAPRAPQRPHGHKAARLGWHNAIETGRDAGRGRRRRAKSAAGGVAAPRVAAGYAARATAHPFWIRAQTGTACLQNRLQRVGINGFAPPATGLINQASCGSTAKPRAGLGGYSFSAARAGAGLAAGSLNVEGGGGVTWRPGTKSRPRAPLAAAGAAAAAAAATAAAAPAGAPHSCFLSPRRSS